MMYYNVSGIPNKTHFQALFIYSQSQNSHRRKPGGSWCPRRRGLDASSLGTGCPPHVSSPQLVFVERSNGWEQLFQSILKCNIYTPHIFYEYLRSDSFCHVCQNKTTKKKICNQQKVVSNLDSRAPERDRGDRQLLNLEHLSSHPGLSHRCWVPLCPLTQPLGIAWVKGKPEDDLGFPQGWYTDAGESLPDSSVATETVDGDYLSGE